MSNTIFEIRFGKMYDKHSYRAMVEITRHTENVIRFTIKAGIKEIKMEKLLFRKTNKWKILNANFPLVYNAQGSGASIKANAKMIMDIQDIIDYHLKQMFPNRFCS